MIAATALVLAAALGVLVLLLTREDASTGAQSGPGQAVAPVGGADGALLRAGNVVLRSGPGQLADTRAVARRLAGPDTPALRQAGQAVVVRAGTAAGVTAQAAGRVLVVRRPSDEQLAAFVERWLGRGA